MKKEKINFKENLKEYWGIVRHQKGSVAMILIMVTLLQIFVLGVSFLFKVIIDNGTEFSSGNLERAQFVNILLIVAGIFFAIILFRSIARYVESKFLNSLLVKSDLHLKKKYFNHITGLSHRFHTTHKTGTLISKLKRGENGMDRLNSTLVFQIIPVIISTIVVLFSVAYFNFVLVFVIAAVSISFISYSLFLQSIQQKYHIDYNKKEDVEKGFVSDSLANIETIKYFGKEKLIKKRYSRIAEEVKLSLYNYFSIFQWIHSGQSLIIGIGTFFILYFPMVKFLNNEMTIGTVAFIYAVFGNLTSQLVSFFYGLRDFYKSMADFQELFKYKKIKNEIKDKKDAKDLNIRKGEIEFKDVSFSYGRKKAFSLDRFNLKIRKDERVAFVGHSGCGKTTLIKLLYRLYDTKEGDVLIDGKGVRDFEQESLRSELSIVPQECILFDDSIYNNIKFSNPNASRKDVTKAIKSAQLGKFIDSLPIKERTIVGERGIKLSGGEKQRVSIARAILADKRVLILDEATSALDSQTEYLIQNALQKLMKGRTSIVIAHRLSTIMNADRIIVMKKGRIIQQGNHNSLISQKGEYKKLWNLQKGGYLK